MSYRRHDQFGGCDVGPIDQTERDMDIGSSAAAPMSKPDRDLARELRPALVEATSSPAST
jgi:hypothetical protein